MLEATAQRPFLASSSRANDQLLDGTGLSGADEKIAPWGRAFGLALPVLASIGLMALAASVLLHFREPLAAIGRWGYLGAFLAELGNSAVILVPTPAPAYTFAMGVALNPLVLGLVGGIGAALGELAGYFLGLRGRGIVEGGRLYESFRALTARWTGAALFAFAVLPVPFDLAGVWAGSVRYSPYRFFVYVMAGKIIKVTTVASAGYYGVTWLIGPLG